MNQNKQYIFLVSLLILLLLSLIGIMIYYLMPTKKSVETISTFSLSPTSPPAQKTPTEPLVEKWQVYANEQFNFSLQIPDKWHVQDYAKIYPNGGTLIAFPLIHCHVILVRIFEMGTFH